MVSGGAKKSKMNNNLLKISAKMKKGMIKAPDGKVRV